MIGGSLTVEPLSARHDVGAFDCGEGSLNVFLRKHAYQHPRQGLSQTWVVLRDHGVAAYFTLAVGSLTYAAASPRVTKGMPRHDLPVLLLARLAVDRTLQGAGLGSVVLEVALRKAMALADAARESSDVAPLPVRAILVHALNDRAAAFYERRGFETSPLDPLHLMMSIKDLRQSLRHIADDTVRDVAPPGRRLP